MTVRTSKAFSGPYLADGKKTEFDFYFETHYDSEIAVYITDEYGDVQLVDDGYTITLNDNGGKVVFETPPAAAEDKNAERRVTILRNVPFTQETDLELNEAFQPEVIETGFDRVVMMVQQLGEATDRAIKIPIGSKESAEEFTDRFFAKAEEAIQAAEEAEISAQKAAASAESASSSAVIAELAADRAEEMYSSTTLLYSAIQDFVSSAEVTLTGIVDSGTSNLTTIISGGTQAITNIVDSGTSNLTTIISGGTQIISSAVSSGVSNLTTIISGGSNLLSEGLSSGGQIISSIISAGETQKEEIASKGAETEKKVEQLIISSGGIALKLTNYYTKVETDALFAGLKGGLVTITEEMAGDLRDSLSVVIDEMTPDEEVESEGENES